MNYYHRKLYALLHDAENPEIGTFLCGQLRCFEGELRQVNNLDLSLPRTVADSSDRLNFKRLQTAFQLILQDFNKSGRSSKLFCAIPSKDL
jgi:hypothetical protein